MINSRDSKNQIEENKSIFDNVESLVRREPTPSWSLSGFARPPLISYIWIGNKKQDSLIPRGEDLYLLLPKNTSHKRKL